MEAEWYFVKTQTTILLEKQTRMKSLEDRIDPQLRSVYTILYSTDLALIDDEQWQKHKIS